MGLNPVQPRRWRTRLRFADGMGALAGPDATIAWGFTDFAGKMADVFCAVGRDGRIERLAAQSHGDGVALAPGATVRSGEVGVFFGRGMAPLQAWASELGRRSGARTGTRAPAGWCSWYRYFTAVSEADVDENLAVLAKEKDRLGLAVFQLDDGYQRAVGDWLETNRKFPRGLRPVADRIRAAGFVPGLWLAPFFARNDSRLCREHPDWFLRDARGRLRRAGFNPLWGGFLSALDLTHPAVKEWLRGLLRTVAREWGFDFVKIDFVYAGALDGVRHDASKTRFQACREALEIIRGELGDRLLLGCGAPLGPSAGIVDLMRVGPDVDPKWRRPLQDRLLGVPEGPGAFWSLRNSLTRHFLHGRLWINDPDCLLVRAHDTRLSEAEVRTLASALGLLGGMVLVSDDMARLEPDRAAMLEAILPVTSVPAEPPDVFRAAVPDLLVGGRRGDWVPVALFNWAETPADRTLAAGEAGLPEAPAAIFDFWERCAFEQDFARGALDAGTLDAHGSKVLQIAPAGGHPRLAGTTIHLAREEVRSERWDEGNGRLVLEAGLPGGREGEWWIHSAGRALAGVEASGAEVGRLEATAPWTRLHVRLGENAVVTIGFER